MKIEYKSLFLGISLGIVGVFSVLYLFGNVETELSFATGDTREDKNIEVRIDKTIENGEDLTNVVLKGKGDVTRDEAIEALKDYTKLSEQDISNAINADYQNLYNQEKHSKSLKKIAASFEETIIKRRENLEEFKKKIKELINVTLNLEPKKNKKHED